MTIQQVISKCSVAKNAAVMLQTLVRRTPGMPNDIVRTADAVVEETTEALVAIEAVAASTGAGSFPNTLFKAGLYMLVNDASEMTAALTNGWVLATFPETMIKAGAPDLVVHNSVEKDAAISNGYSLPGLGRLPVE